MKSGKKYEQSLGTRGIYSKLEVVRIRWKEK